MGRIRRRLLAGGGALLLVLLLLGLLVVYTDVGTPRSHHDHEALPDPCQLLHEPTVRELAGDVTLSVDVDEPPRSRAGLIRDTGVRLCIGTSDDVSDGLVHASTYLFSSAQFALGRTGEQQASDMLADQQERMHGQVYPDGCRYELRDGRGTACGMYDDSSALLYIQQENLFLEISFPSFQDSRQADPDPPVEDLMATLTETALSQLADVAS